MNLPEKLLQSLEAIKGFDREAFEKVHASGEQVTSIRINPQKLSEASQVPSTGGHLGEAVPWTEYGYYLNQRPSFTFDPLFHAGCYYVQEASSMFLEQAFKQTVDLSRRLRILDLSAAPGGKSTHIQSLISKDSLLVSNEVIRSRANILKDNIAKWGSDNVIVTNNDPKSFARLENYFDAIIVDAPCSGSGLFRRDEKAIDEWSENNVHLCSQRQQRILADVWSALKRNGVLIYSTCSYSNEENENIVQWMTAELPIAHCPLPIDNSWGIIETENGYRFWPDQVKGEGFFIACMRKLGGEDKVEIKVKKKIEIVSKKEMEVVKYWIKATDHQFLKIGNVVYAVPKGLSTDIDFLLSNLQIIYFGTMVGELVRDKLIPAHALAMSNLISDHVERIELNYEQAIDYLKKKDLREINGDKGWKLVTYKNYPLGWINILSNRINNYYPRELRILKDI
ncbi:MAG: Fmu (Sun) domain protein [Bacteroidetes bacterium]|nr:MAG: Fmu (Sun) domain protein [Bacteroidota bacterium]